MQKWELEIYVKNTVLSVYLLSKCTVDANMIQSPQDAGQYPSLEESRNHN